LGKSKIYGRKALAGIISGLKKRGNRIVFTNGCFDIVHAGHVRLFQGAKALGDKLIVAINSDRSLKKLKGPKRPLVPQAKRAYVVSAQESVDFVTVFGEQTPARIIKELKPDILVKGGDYNINEIIGRENVKRVVTIPLLKGQSTTALIKLIVSRYAKC
jgi:D-glycero-beta-D-manno-heptose 1-phosphate adenylyltransferase